MLYQSDELAENVSKVIDPQFADRIDMSEVQVENPPPLSRPFNIKGLIFRKAAVSCRTSSQQLLQKH